MNINELVRSAGPESAGWMRSNDGRRVLDEVITAAPAGSASGRTAWERSAARRSALRWSVLGTGLVGAAAAVAVAVAGPGVAPHNAPGTASGVESTTGQAPMNSSQLLLAAAERSDNAPAGGRYLTIQTENGFA